MSDSLGRRGRAVADRNAAQRNTFFRLNVVNVLDGQGSISDALGRVSCTGITTALWINVKFSTSVVF